jgi:hypothetical protein
MPIDDADLRLTNRAKAAAEARAADAAVANANALADLASSGSTTTPSDALRKLTSGGTLTEGERALLNMGPLPKPVQTPATGASIEENARLDQIAKDAEAARLAGKKDSFTVNPNNENQALFNGVPFNGVRNGLTFINGYRQDLYDESGKERTKTQTQTQPASNNDALLQQLLAQQNAAAAAAALAKQQARQSAIDVVTARFAAYGLGTLASKIKELAVDGATEATITLGLQSTDEYKTRFKANDARIKAGLQVLQPAEYLNLEDGYRQVLRSYGLTQFSTDEYVQQFIANDVSAKELSDRVSIATQRVQNADPAVLNQLQSYYGIGPKDAVAYILDPNQQITKIQRQVAAAEIGVAAGKQGLQSNVAVSEQLAAQGIDQATAQKGYATIADYLPTAEKLSQIYGQVGQYDQSTAEQDVFNQLASAQRTRKKLSETEVAAFSGSSGAAKGAFSTGYLNKPTNAGQF